MTDPTFAVRATDMVEGNAKTSLVNTDVETGGEQMACPPSCCEPGMFNRDGSMKKLHVKSHLCTFLLHQVVSHSTSQCQREYQQVFSLEQKAHFTYTEYTQDCNEQIGQCV